MTLSPYAVTTEAQLLRGYVRASLIERIVPCACGGRIRAFDVPAAILTAVVAHHETPRHRRWRVAQEAA